MRKTTRTYRTKNHSSRSYGRNKTRRTTTNRTTYACHSRRFRPPRKECQWRIGSYRNVYSQFTPAGSQTVLSPTTATKWIKYVNNGALVYKFNNAPFSRYFGPRWTTGTPTAARQYMRRKFGAGIKDVTRGKGNCWLVATTKNMNRSPFCNYNWK